MSTITDDAAFRRKFSMFIRQAGIRLAVPQLTVCTAIRFFHRFYDSCSPDNYEPFMIARTCLFAACKSEETTRRLRDTINATHCVMHNINQSSSNTTTSAPNKSTGSATEPNATKETKDLDSQFCSAREYWPLKDDLVRHEQILLRVLNFDLDVVHPHHFILHYLRRLGPAACNCVELSRLAWSICSDTVLTSLPSQYEPHVLAIGSIHMAGTLLHQHQHKEITQSSFNLNVAPAALSFLTGSSHSGASDAWWERFDVQRMQLEDVCLQLCDLYDVADLGEPLPLPVHESPGLIRQTSGSAMPSRRYMSAPVYSNFSGPSPSHSTFVPPSAPAYGQPAYQAGYSSQIPSQYGYQSSYAPPTSVYQTPHYAYPPNLSRYATYPPASPSFHAPAAKTEQSPSQMYSMPAPQHNQSIDETRDQQHDQPHNQQEQHEQQEQPQFEQYHVPDAQISYAEALQNALATQYTDDEPELANLQAYQSYDSYQNQTGDGTEHGDAEVMDQASIDVEAAAIQAQLSDEDMSGIPQVSAQEAANAFIEHDDDEALDLHYVSSDGNVFVDRYRAPREP